MVSPHIDTHVQIKISIPVGVYHALRGLTTLRLSGYDNFLLF